MHSLAIWVYIEFTSNKNFFFIAKQKLMVLIYSVGYRYIFRSNLLIFYILRNFLYIIVIVYLYNVENKVDRIR